MRNENDRSDEPETSPIDSAAINQCKINEAGSTAFYHLKNGDLYSCNLSGTKRLRKIDANVSQFSINPEGSRIVYITEDGTLYQQDFGGKKDKEEISSAAKLLYTSKDLGYLFYSNNTTLYRKAFDTKAELITSKMKQFVNGYEDGTVYYIRGTD